MTMRRFRVAEGSMQPTFHEGDEFVATDSRSAEVGDLVALLHPRRDDFWLVKRVVAGPGDRVGTLVLGPGESWVSSDSPIVGTVDSRTFGPVAHGSLWPVVTRLDVTTFAEACDLLAGEDHALAGVIAEWGLPAFWQRPAGFGTLVLLMLEQQVSLESGAAVFRRLGDLTGGVSPETVVAAGEAALRGVGITRQKSGYLVTLAEACLSGELDLEELGTMSILDARDRLLSVKGIGPWTADTYLLSALRVPDVFPLGDRALQVGAMEALGLGTPPGPGELEILAEPWRPVRAAAARLIWHGYLARRGRVEPSHPDTQHAKADPA